MDKPRVEGISDVILVTTNGSVMSTELIDWLRYVVKKKHKGKWKVHPQESFAIVNEKPISAETDRRG